MPDLNFCFPSYVPRRKTCTPPHLCVEYSMPDLPGELAGFPVFPLSTSAGLVKERRALLQREITVFYYSKCILYLSAKPNPAQLQIYCLDSCGIYVYTVSKPKRWCAFRAVWKLFSLYIYRGGQKIRETITIHFPCV
jgi:hypothetical protein